MSPATGVLPIAAIVSASVGAELSLAVRVTRNVAEPLEPFEPLLPFEPSAPLYPLKATARIGYAVFVQSRVEVVVVAEAFSGTVMLHR